MRSEMPDVSHLVHHTSHGREFCQCFAVNFASALPWIPETWVILKGPEARKMGPAPTPLFDLCSRPAHHQIHSKIRDSEDQIDRSIETECFRHYFGLAKVAD
jgi:hypothetical protein